MKEVTLQISIDEANIILEALGNLPFVKVYALIAKIQDQAGKQLNNGEQQSETNNLPHVGA